MINPPPLKPASPETPESLRVFLVVMVVSLPAVLAEYLATTMMHSYGYGVFIVVPLAMGVVSALLYNRGRAWRLGATIGVVTLSLLVTGLAMLMLRIEGVICLFMALPLAWVVGLIGLFTGWLSRRAKARNQSLLFLLFGLTPFTVGFESSFKPEVPLHQQTTSIEIDAPPDVVWRYVPAFPIIKAAPTGLLKLDLAYPLASEMTGAGVGAERQCILSTGIMPEIITAWEPGQRLEFKVLSTPPAMAETNAFGHSETAHAKEYFKVQRGQFVLTALPGGRTRVEGTSWFEHNIWPQAYWAPLTRRVVKGVHQRVLIHIKQLAEADQTL